MTAASTDCLRMEGVRKRFRGPDGREVEILHGIDFSLPRGGYGVVTGPSGSGKTTFLMVAGLLLPPDAGRMWFAGRDVSALGERERTEVRKTGVGVVFQKFCLVPGRSALANVELRFRYLRRPAGEVRRLSLEALERVGLAGKARQAARLLSAGEMQRVAIARAIAQPPELLLADEPTGNLDSGTAGRIMELFAELNREGMAVLVVTHHPAWEAPESVRRWVLREGGLFG
jgi:putative ABC transport system ATP-binding protein